MNTVQSMTICPLTLPGRLQRKTGTENRDQRWLSMPLVPKVPSTARLESVTCLKEALSMYYPPPWVMDEVDE